MSLLLKAVSSSDTTLMITPDTSFPAVDGVIKIESEIINYTVNYMGTLYGCVRGVQSTSAASHVINSTVSLLDFFSSTSGTIFDEPITVNNATITQSQTYTGASSNQGIASDETLDTTAGRDKEDGGSFQASIMGNVHATSLTKTGNYTAGVIGAYSVSSTNASELPKGAVIGDIQDPSNSADGIFVAVIDGNDPSGVTRANAAFKARQLNSNAGSGVDFGVDLYDTAVSGYLSSPTLPLAIAKADIRCTNQVCWLNGAGVPVDGTTGDNFAQKGSLYTDTTNGDLYIQTSAITTPVWKLVTRAA